ncbi:TIGR03621 family F420-dependent LLM class oxidoreductase [Micromonospora sp. NPDC092111]|uniref:TIGR03621 family F420-dependent LLM class oxidoreductase n=1 Tax=Micromonospora sp. NPDC092111 TaxID=3364289 RepID=UPI003823D162
MASGGAATEREWRELARRVEGSGVDLLTMTDHIHQPMAPFTALATAAAVTTTLRLGTYVLCQDLRNPVILAKEFATLDLLSDGRAEMGLGAGWRRSDYTRTGIGFGSRPERFDRFVEYVDIVGALLAGGPVTYRGRHLSVADASNLPVPAKPVPLLIGGSRRRLIELAARRADTVSIAPSRHPDGRRSTYWDTEIDDRVRWAYVAAEAAGRPARPEIDLAIHECRVVADPAPVLAEFSATFGVPEDRVGAVPSLLVGTPEQVVEALLARRERWGASRVTIPDTALDAMAPVVARLAGT